jgi:hypothetical protein
MSSAAIAVTTSGFATTVVVIATAQSATCWPGRSGWKTDDTSFSNTQYLHVVFTVPEPIAAIALQNKEIVYSILLRAAAETLRTIAADPKHLGAQIGFFAVLHTWGQVLFTVRTCIA